MVEVGKKYRHKDWTTDWVHVNCIGKILFLGDLQNGHETWFHIGDDWIEIKQRPKTLADCYREGDFEAKKVAVNGELFYLTAYEMNPRFACIVGISGEAVRSFCDLYEAKIWPEVLIDDV